MNNLISFPWTILKTNTTNGRSNINAIRIHYRVPRRHSAIVNHPVHASMVESDSAMILLQLVYAEKNTA
jgi:hypothetical protein